MGLWWRWCRQIILIVLKLWFEQILISSSFWPKCEKYELMEIWPPMYVPYLVHNKLHGIHIFMWNLFWQLTDSDYQKLPNMKLWTFPIARMTKSEFLKGGKIWFPKRCCEEMQYLLKYLIILTLSKEYLSWSNSVLSWNLSSQRSHAQLRSYFSNRTKLFREIIHEFWLCHDSHKVLIAILITYINPQLHENSEKSQVLIVSGKLAI